MTRNPYRRAERITARVFGVLGYALLAVVLGAIIWAAWTKYEWGPLALLIIPGIPLAFIVALVLAWVATSIESLIKHAWSEAKWRWENEHADEMPEPTKAELRAKDLEDDDEPYEPFGGEIR